MKEGVIENKCLAFDCFLNVFGVLFCVCLVDSEIRCPFCSGLKLGHYWLLAHRKETCSSTTSKPHARFLFWVKLSNKKQTNTELCDEKEYNLYLKIFYFQLTSYIYNVLHIYFGQILNDDNSNTGVW